jgi:hypothetical protein
MDIKVHGVDSTVNCHSDEQASEYRPSDSFFIEIVLNFLQSLLLHKY